MSNCTCYRQPIYEEDKPVKIVPNDCPLHGRNRTRRKLTPNIEAWLRRYIPVWATMRDHAVAAGLIEPEAPGLSEAEAEKINKIAKAVKATLARQRPANQNGRG